jgi:transposase
MPTDEGSTIRISLCQSQRVVMVNATNDERRAAMSEEYAVLVGLDWADQKHDLCLMETDTGKMSRLVLKHQQERINEWIGDLIARYPGCRFAVCLEQSRGAVVYALMGYAEVDLYPVNPVTLSDYRNAFKPSGAKDDPTDAGLLLDLLLRHRKALKVWRPDTEQTRLLSSLCEDRRKAVDLRTCLCNSLRSKLKEYYPQALNLVGEELFSELCCAFLMKWPTFKVLATTRLETIRRFYHEHNCRSEQRINERLDLIGKSRPLTTDSAVVEAGSLWSETIIGQIRAINRSIDRYDKRIGEVFKDHPDRFIFDSFPGAGKQLAPRLVAAFGTDRSRYEAATNVANYFGVSPVIERSGKQEWVRWRWHCPKFLRQSAVEFAGKSIGFSRWAEIYYREQIRRGKDHQAAIRALAFKWIRILFRCWQDRTAYNEAKYMAALERHGSWIAVALKAAA